MARELILDVIAKKHSEDLSRLASEFDKAASKVEGAGKSFAKTATLSQTLDKELAKAKDTVKQLGEEYNKTGSVDVFKNLKKAQGDVRQLEGIKKTLSSALGDAGDEGGKNFRQRFERALAGNVLVKSVGNGLAGISGIWSVVTPLLVAGAPIAGAEIGAALLTGVGLAGIGAGIAGQLHDPQVQKAGADLGRNLSDEFKNATINFKTPTIAAIHEIDNEVRKLGPELRHTFDQLAPLTADLGHGVTGFIDKLAPSLERAAVAGKPLVELFSNRLPSLGAALGNIFDAASRNSREAADGLNLLINTVDVALNGVAFTTDVLSKAFDIAKFTTGPLAIFTDMGKKGHDSGTQIADAFKQAAASLAGFSSEANGAAAQAQQLNKDITSLFGATLNLDQANIQLKGDMAGLKGQLDSHSKSLDTNTAAGRTNASALLQIAQDAERAREAAIAHAGGENASAAAVANANAKYRASIGQLEALAVKLGLTGAQVRALLDKYRALANSPDITKNIYFQTHYSSPGGKTPYANKPIPFAHGGIRTAAFGMFIPPSDPGTVLTGEPQTGGEVLAPLRGNSVVRQAALLNTAGANYGLKVVPRGGGDWYGGARVSRGGSAKMSLSFVARPGAGAMEQAVLQALSIALQSGGIQLQDGNGQPVRVR